ncbi:MAG: 3'-5' exoribonuclease [Anaerolineae bacterium]|nr:3'-5' exoribonuclease [Anaerolineae bacterium]
MRGPLISLDLETTGLDPADAQIMEIGAVRFKDGEILETYSTLVDPGVPIPQRVTDITGITKEDLLGAPRLADVLPALVEFVGDSPIVGHNVDFDLRFLYKQNVLTDNLSIDTYELASALLPTTARYNLGALMQVMDIALIGMRHRALADALGTAKLYTALWNRLLQRTPVELVHEIAALARQVPEWGGRLPFEAASRAREGERVAREDVALRGLRTPVTPSEPLRPMPAAPDAAERRAVLAHMGITDPAVVGLAEAVAGALDGGQKALIEAPADDLTPGYLVAAGLWAAHHGERVVISTGGPRARKRLLDEHLPALQRALGPERPVRAAVLRERGAYLCPARLAMLRRQRAASVEELRVLAKTLVWLAEGGDHGAGEQLSIRGPGEFAAWARLSAAAEGCPISRCETQQGGICPLFRARRAAQDAHLVIVEHGLLLPDATSHDPILPDYRRVIVDEANLLEDLTTDAQHIRLDAMSIRRRAAEVGTPDRGVLAEVLAETGAALPAADFEQFAGGVGIVAQAAEQMAHHADAFFAAMGAFVQTMIDPRGLDFVLQVRLNAENRGRRAFGQVHAAWGTFSQFTGALGGKSGALAQVVKRLRLYRDRYNLPALDNAISALQGIARDLEHVHRWLGDAISGANEALVYWAEVSPDRMDRLTLHSAPLRPGDALSERVWAHADSAVLLGSALRAGSGFEYLQGRLGADKFAREVVAAQPEPAQTAESAQASESDGLLVYLPVDMPEPNDRDSYQRAVSRAIIELGAAIPDRILALFTSMTQLRGSSQHIALRLKLGDNPIPTFDQSDGRSAGALLEGFLAAPRGVLLGVRGHWEDAEFAADDLGVLIVVRLPFAVPSEPIIAARTEASDDGFNHFTLPHAVLRFRASLARFAQGRTRRGVVVILDRRMTSKTYGQFFIENLPASTVRRGELDDLAGAAAAWLAGA